VDVDRQAGRVYYVRDGKRGNAAAGGNDLAVGDIGRSPRQYAIGGAQGRRGGGDRQRGGGGGHVGVGEQGGGLRERCRGVGGGGVERHVVVGQQAGAIRERASDVVVARSCRGCIPGTVVNDAEVLTVDASRDGGTQVGSEVGGSALGMAVIADLVSEGVLGHR